MWEGKHFIFPPGSGGPKMVRRSTPRQPRSAPTAGSLNASRRNSFKKLQGMSSNLATFYNTICAVGARCIYPVLWAIITMACELSEYNKRSFTDSSPLLLAQIVDQVLVHLKMEDAQILIAMLSENLVSLTEWGSQSIYTKLLKTLPPPSVPPEVDLKWKQLTRWH